jgi:Uma2 family endonuclease
MASPAFDPGRVTRERYWGLVADGVIGPDDRVELLEGVIVAMSPHGPPHSFVIGTLTSRLGALVPTGTFLRVQLPLDVSDWSTPEPDFAVVAGRPADYADAHPTTALLVIEVADGSLAQDRITKGAIYAAAGIPEYWIVNLRDRGVEVHRDPIAPERRYRDVARRVPGETLSALHVPHAAIAVADVLPPAR